LAARDRLEQREVRSYEVEHVLQLLHLDFHHGSRKVLTRGGEYVKPRLVGFIDDRSRFLCHAQWYTSEGTEQLVHGLCQALQINGVGAAANNNPQLLFDRMPHPRPRPPAQRVRRDDLFENAHRVPYADTYDVPT
jgi:hypothetical protein